jgi:transcriptional regulator with GAF, ATPase, and Fis domain
MAARLPFDDLLFALTQERSHDRVVSQITDHLAEIPEVALARIWWIDDGDICESCPVRAECPGYTKCLHLVASAGRSQVDPVDEWSRLDGDFRRFPMGTRKVGMIASTGRPMEVHQIRPDQPFLARPEWIVSEGIQAFAGYPLVFKGEVLGVLALFWRAPLTEDACRRQQVLANHAAASLANARAFERIECLREALEMENSYLREEVQHAMGGGSIVGDSPAMSAVYDKIQLVGPTDANVLILGESGTGKELVAREIHRNSNRAQQPLVRVNCASIPRDLYESEFFGHVKGAFTGAVRDRIGRFEMADGGTLLLDEVGEIPLELQSKLLRVLQEGQFERVGDEKTRNVDVRIVAATNRDLREEVSRGRFREDLYYRLDVFPIEIAPLRERKGDIPLLASHFLDVMSQRMNVPRPRLTKSRVQQLQAHSWPGNVRELQNVIERAVITAQGGRLVFDTLDRSVAQVPEHAPTQDRGDILTDAELRQLECDNIQRALEAAGGKVYGKKGAAELLDIKPTTLASRIKKLGLS